MLHQTIAIANQKGGVGKTTLSVHLAQYLAGHGHPVIIVDADPQGNASSWITGTLDRCAWAEILIHGKDPIDTLTVCSKPWSCALLASNQQTAFAYDHTTRTRDPGLALHAVLAPLHELADYTLIDMPPSLSPAFDAILQAADLILIPTRPARLALEGIAHMARTAQDITRRSGRARLLGIVPNLVRRTTEHTIQIHQLMRVYGPLVWPPIPEAIAIDEASAFGETVFTHSPGSPAAQALRIVCSRVVENTR